MRQQIQRLCTKIELAVEDGVYSTPSSAGDLLCIHTFADALFTREQINRKSNFSAAPRKEACESERRGCYLAQQGSAARPPLEPSAHSSSARRRCLDVGGASSSSLARVSTLPPNLRSFTGSGTDFPSHVYGKDRRASG